MTIDESKPHRTVLGWRCGKCGKIYNIQELIELTQVNYGSGNMPICSCSYRFFFDKWKLQDIVKVKMGDNDVDILVSTVYLELNHGFFDRDLWYETMVFVEGFEGAKNRCICRYETGEQAIAGHNKMLELIRSGNYKLTNDTTLWHS